MTTIGEVGEAFVASWLDHRGWQILQRRWRSRWGEIDLIAQSESLKMLAFIEVKTRQRANWDNGGLLAVNAQKQRKLIQTAQLFFAKYPHWSDLPCRFDVVLVQYQGQFRPTMTPVPPLLAPQSHLSWQGYDLWLADYVEGAFDT